ISAPIWERFQEENMMLSNSTELKAGENQTWELQDYEYQRKYTIRESDRRLVVWGFPLAGDPPRQEIFRFDTPRALDAVVQRLNHWLGSVPPPPPSWRADPLLGEIPAELRDVVIVFNTLDWLKMPRFH